MSQASERPVIRVVLVDDHSIVREGLSALLAGVDDIEIVASVGGGRVAVDRCAEILPDVVLMDLAMPDVDGVAATRMLMERVPGARVLALTSFLDEKLLREVLDAGATGFLLKTVTAADLVHAIHATSQGRPIVDPEALPFLVGRRSEHRIGDDLTARERDVLELLVRGLTNKGVAAELGLSPGTVRVYVSNVLVKLGAGNRTEATAIALRHRLLEPR